MIDLIDDDHASHETYDHDDDHATDLVIRPITIVSMGPMAMAIGTTSSPMSITTVVVVVSVVAI